MSQIPSIFSGNSVSKYFRKFERTQSVLETDFRGKKGRKLTCDIEWDLWG